MTTTKPIKDKIQELKQIFGSLKKGKESLLILIEESEIFESVYNSNAIENSTLTLKETENILLNKEIKRNVLMREVFEAKSLARVLNFIRNQSSQKDLTKAQILEMHKILIENIEEEISGRFRASGEYVRVGYHIAPPPEHVELIVESILSDYEKNDEKYFVDKIALFHLKFENTHPFLDGNGRIGRSIINYQLARLGFPSIIIRNKEKKKYYEAFRAFDSNKNTKLMEKVIQLAILESLHKRISYLKGQKIISLSEYVKDNKLLAPAVFNSAKRQNIPAFRERGIWEIGV